MERNSNNSTIWTGPTVMLCFVEARNIVSYLRRRRGTILQPVLQHNTQHTEWPLFHNSAANFFPLPAAAALIARKNHEQFYIIALFFEPMERNQLIIVVAWTLREIIHSWEQQQQSTQTASPNSGKKVLDPYGTAVPARMVHSIFQYSLSNLGQVDDCDDGY
jgi:hypothetical protein